MSKHSASDQIPAAHHRLRDSVWRLLAIALLTLLLAPSLTPNVQAQLISVPAEFVRYVSPPGTNNNFLRPTALHFDRWNKELLVGDSGNSRVVIFDRDGVYRFEFSGKEHFSVPMHVVAEPSGTILVLGSSAHGVRLQRFDFDGIFLEELLVAEAAELPELRARSFDVDDEGRIYILHPVRAEITVHENDGSLSHRFGLRLDEKPADADQDLGETIAWGRLRVFGERIYLPITSWSHVQTYDLDGEFLRSIGYPGSVTGAFAGPSNVDVASDGTILVLDTRRYNILCFDPWGKFLGEFGGKGSSPGWFNWPSLMTVNDLDQVCVGQIFLNRVQICRIPEVIRPNLRQTEPEASPHGPSDGGEAVGWFDTELPARSARTMTAALGRTLASGRSDDLSLMTPAFYQYHFGGGQ